MKVQARRDSHNPSWVCHPALNGFLSLMRKSRAVKRVVGILKAFSEEKPQLGITELATILGLPKSVVHGDLMALVDERIIEKDYNTGKYYLGNEIFQLGSILLKQKSLRQNSIPVMERISKIIMEGVTLIAWIGSIPYCIESIDSPHPLKVSLNIGQSFPVHAGSAGKLLLAFLPEQEREQMIKGLRLTRYTEKTITTISELRRRLNEIREKGYVVSAGERFKDVISVGAPIFNHNSRGVACICITMPSNRSNRQRISQCVSLVVEGAREISQKLGFEE